MLQLLTKQKLNNFFFTDIKNAADKVCGVFVYYL